MEKRVCVDVECGSEESGRHVIHSFPLVYFVLLLLLLFAFTGEIIMD